MKRSIYFLFFGIFGIIVLVSAQQPSPKASIARGKTTYSQYCMACHQEDGAGVPRLNPPLIKSKFVTGDKKALIKIVIKGLKGGEIEVDGDKFENPMTPHDFLKDQEIADVLTYVRNSFGNKASTVTVSDVKSQRAALKK